MLDSFDKNQYNYSLSGVSVSFFFQFNCDDALTIILYSLLDALIYALQTFFNNHNLQT